MEQGLSRYQILGEIGAGAMGAVYRAQDRLSGSTVALKRVTVSEKSLIFSSHASMDTRTSIRMTLAQEFRTLASLRHPHIISVLDYGFDQNQQAYFTMELLEGAQTIFKAGQGKPLKFQIQLLTQMLQALVYLHRRGIVHRDLKPDNVLVVNGQVKVLDFGLAVAHDLKEESDKVVGTLAYMAPEVLSGSPATPVSDLYGVGMIAYELFSGHYPFQTNNMVVLLQNILETVPDVYQLDLSEDLQHVVQRLLMKSPQDRFSSAYDALAALYRASGSETQVETLSIRESFLQAARFVGRDQELTRLRQVLKTAADGTGSAWLVGGESGVGKTRLLNELRTLALVTGSQVIVGQSISEGEGTYYVWRDVLRMLALRVTLTDTEAGVLKTVIPDLDALLGRDIQPAPDTDPQSAQARFLETVTAILQRHRQPLLVILEDIHWAGSDSLALLKRLSELIQSMPVLILASYRNDERPDLPARLPQMQVMTLDRLKTSSIAELSESMLGAAGRKQAVIDLLERETEGNVFFMVEIVRALAEDAGQLDMIGVKTLPARIFAGRIQSVIERRLSRISEPDQKLLRLAAVIGRQINLDLMRFMYPDVDFDAWLNVCAEAVLDVHDGGAAWRFSHDKIRDTLLAQIGDDERPELHRRVAEAVEEKESSVNDHAAVLAHHWRMAGNLWQELRFAGIAGRQALMNSANQEAIGYFRRALEILDMVKLPEMAEQELNLLVALSGALMAVEGYASPEVVEVSERARELCGKVGETPLLLRVLSSLAGYYVARAEYDKAYDLASQLLELATRLQNSAGMLAGHILIGQALFFMGRWRETDDHMRPVIETYDPNKRRSRPTFGQDFGVTGWIFHGATQWILGYPDQGEAATDRALDIARSLDHSFTMAFALNWATNHYVYRREFDRAYEYSEAVLRLAEQKGFAMFVGTNIVQHYWLSSQRGESSAELYQQLLDGLQYFMSTGARFCLPYFLMLIADVEAKIGLVKESLERFDEAFTLARSHNEGWVFSDLHRFRGDVYRRKGDLALAEQEYLAAEKDACERQSKSLELRAVLALCEMWHEQGEANKARERLKPVYDQMTEGFDTVDLKRARELLGV